MKPTLFLCLALLSTGLAPQARAGWQDWVDRARQALEEHTPEEAKELSSQVASQAKDWWDSLEINERLQRAFGDDVDETSALIGRFYDLKQPLPDARTPDGRQPLRPATPQDTVQLIHDFLEAGWDTAVFEPYYSPRVRLYAPFFYLPRCKASYAPKAFQCKTEDKVKPSSWVVLYRGTVKAPCSGKFRFVGMGDDVILVRFQEKTVLEYGWSIPSRNHMTLGTQHNYHLSLASREKDPVAFYPYRETQHWNDKLAGLASGKVFEVEKGKSYPIEILISEIPGAEFGFALLLEEVGDQPPHGFFTVETSPTLHLFRTNKSLPDPERIREALTMDGEDYTVGSGLEGPPFLEDSLVWKVAHADSERQGYFERVFGSTEASLHGKDTALGKQDQAGEGQKEPTGASATQP